MEDEFHPWPCRLEKEIEEGDVDCREGIHYIYTGETHELLLRLYPCTLNRIGDADLIEVQEEGDARGTTARVHDTIEEGEARCFVYTIIPRHYLENISFPLHACLNGANMSAHFHQFHGYINI